MGVTVWVKSTQLNDPPIDKAQNQWTPPWSLLASAKQNLSTGKFLRIMNNPSPASPLHCNLSNYLLITLLAIILSFQCFLSSSLVHSLSPLLGVHPLDEKYYASQVIKCKDGSKSFPRDRLNDDFCDCVDGTDEPGTSACPRGKFYCKNVGSTPQFIFSSRVNDHICDCCDGSDEHDSSINCPNICVMGGNLEYKAGKYVHPLVEKESANHPLVEKESANHPLVEKESANQAMLEDLLHNAKGLKIIIILQVIFIGCVVIVRLFRRHIRLKRRHYR